MTGVAKMLSDFLGQSSADKQPVDPGPRTVSKFDAPDNRALDLHELENTFHESFDTLPDDKRHELAMKIAKTQARDISADVVRRALQEPKAPSLRTIQKAVGIDPSQVSKISVGALAEGPHLWTLFRIALALKKRVVIRFE